MNGGIGGLFEQLWDRVKAAVGDIFDGPEAGPPNINRIQQSRTAGQGQATDIRRTIEAEVGQGRTHTVQRGDTLSAIAARHLGAASRWREIAELNRITNPGSLQVGQILALPPQEQQNGPADQTGPGAQGQAPGGGQQQQGPQAERPQGPQAEGPGTAAGPGQGPGAGGDQAPGNTPAQEPQGGPSGPGAGSSASGEPAWMAKARGEIGVREIVGSRHSPRVLEYHATTGRFTTDEVPWCASFVNWVLVNSGQAGTGSAVALSFRSYGTRLERPAYGSIAVISWGGGKGHVGFVVGKQGSSIMLLGGNQSNSVCVSPFRSSAIVAYVVPAGYTPPESAYELTSSGDVPTGEAGGLGNTR